MGLTAQEHDDIDRANASGRPCIVLVRGLWLLSSSWDRWRAVYEAAGYATIAPGWPDDPATVEEARAHPEVFTDKMVGEVTDHYVEAVAALSGRPALVGHSFGGLVVQKLAAQGVSAATVAIVPAPFRGVLPVPVSSLRSSAAVVGNPANLHRAVTLTFEQYRYGWANALEEDEARALYDEFHVAAAGVPIFQAVAANLNPFSETKLDVAAPDRGPLLIVSGEKDHTIPHAVAHAAFVRQRRNPSPTEFVELAGRGHSLTIDHGWREVADTALQFVRTHLVAGAGVAAEA
ncbi:alpha/beta hydrolase [Cellulomonas marina]|uniref:Lysophospholipase, alpha-beta hydrolase superfamily n=1 Tax=Cellulomonas marina TaxID=988821 RepID=A0A1I0Z1Y0_9CELL|nr:alpha/beta hydrolase [Cellulomonas marina]GIG28184.1 alpha/beta hydrolase [Cellulomonas marina]SFB19571.1 Lysophospholipase, alpha-beta hydrolase superfamily [Cellulomonas marina]